MKYIFFTHRISPLISTFCCLGMHLSRMISMRYPDNSVEYKKKYLDYDPRIIIDESSQVPIASLIALFLTFPRAKFALIGDSKQLPPFRYTMGDLVSEFAARSALDCVRASGNVPVIKFRFVYRCPPSMIKHLQYFYPDVKLVSMKKESEINPFECFTRDRKSRCALFMVEGKTKKSGNSKSNKKELQALLKVVEQLKAEGHGADDPRRSCARSPHNHTNRRRGGRRK